MSASVTSSRLVRPVRARALTPPEAAWVAAVPCALLLAGAMWLLAPPLGEVVFPPADATFWPSVVRRPEPAEHVRYVIALLAWPLLAGAAATAARRRVALRPAAIDALVAGAQALLVAFAVLCLIRQQTAVWPDQPQPDRIFTPPTLAA
ncbi:MAG TPA: hypothetical protein VFS37_11060, partial [Conexibacter sp.]|nr:hypothetical protein [Conexibacter sp.]